MPTTTRGYRYPSSSAAPNVPQDIQNLASDLDADQALRQWVTVYEGADTYSQTATTTATPLLGCSGSVTVATNRNLEVDLQIPRMNVPVNGGLFVRLAIDGTIYRTAGVQTGSTTSLAVPAYLHVKVPGTGSSMTFLATVYGSVGFGNVEGAHDGSAHGGPLFRYRIT